MEIANDTLTWKDGVCYLIDDSFEHAVVSPKWQKRPRAILEIKMTHPDLATSTGVLEMTSYRSHKGTKPPRFVRIAHGNTESQPEL